MGLYSTRNVNNDAVIYLWEITESEEELRQICNFIPEEEQEELQIIKSSARRREKLAVRALINHIFPEMVYLGHHDNGKPYIQNSSVEISISHTSRFVAIMVHPEEVVGLDIECTSRDFAAVEKKALSEDEREDIDDKRYNFHLAIYWTAKEAIFKRMSQFGVDFAEQIEVEKFNPKEEGELEAVFTFKDGHQEEFELNYETIEDHVMTWLVG